VTTHTNRTNWLAAGVVTALVGLIAALAALLLPSSRVPNAIHAAQAAHSRAAAEHLPPVRAYHAQPSADDLFIFQISTQAFYRQDMRSNYVSLAHTICDSLTGPQDVYTAGQLLLTDRFVNTSYEAGVFMGAAVSEICPQDKWMMPTN
jgi:hypothetical protein